MKKAKCFKCKRVLTYNSSFAGKGEFVKNKRDSDGLDVFECGYFMCHAEFKIDMIHYSKNSHKKNFIIKTVDAKYDFSEGIDNPKKKKLFGIF
ncbi:MAG: hypothetical protein H8E55_62145 [Pelagibacterales bacterium]|nr:hypothetical protein [Pelagibacterales bacterium]